MRRNALHPRRRFPRNPIQARLDLGPRSRELVAMLSCETRAVPPAHLRERAVIE